MKTALVLLVAILAQAAGNTCLSRAMKVVGAHAGPSAGFSADIVVRGMETPLVWLGILLLLVFFALFAATLSWDDLSFVLPLSSFGYVVNVAFARWFLDEAVSPVRWLGTLLVVVGLVLVSRTARPRQATAALEATGAGALAPRAAGAPGTAPPRAAGGRP